MKNNKGALLDESVMPLLPLPKEIREIYEQNAAGMVRAASKVAGNLREA